jgi:TPR repeat protein
MNLTARPWIVAILLGLLALPYAAHAGMTPKEVKSFEGYKERAEKGDRVAQLWVGYCYELGEGVAKDQVKAVSWWRKAAEQGENNAQSNLAAAYAHGDGVAKDAVEAAKWYRKAAVQGNSYAQYSLGRCYANGNGVAKDEIESYAYYNLTGHQFKDSARENLAVLEKKMSSEQIAAGKKRTIELQKEIAAKMAEDEKQAGK